MIFNDNLWANFAYFFIKIYVVGTHQNRLAEVILMSTHNIGFYEDLTKIIFQLSSTMHLIFSSAKVLIKQQQLRLYFTFGPLRSVGIF